MVFIKRFKNTTQTKKRKILIVFDDMIADIVRNKKLNPIVTKLFIRGKKLSVSLVFVTRPDFDVTKGITLNSTHYLIMKIANKQKIQQITFNYSSNIHFKDVMNL